jgi:DNA-binding CsgD family transcriptional regulator
MPRRQSKSSAKSTIARERERQVVALKKAGANFQQIADKLGITKPGAYKAWKRVNEQLAKATREDAELLRAQQLERINDMLLGLWNKAASGDVQAVDRVVRLLERESKLLGLDSPQKKELSGPGGEPIGGIVVEFVKPEKNGGDGGGGAGNT